MRRIAFGVLWIGSLGFVFLFATSPVLAAPLVDYSRGDIAAGGSYTSEDESTALFSTFSLSLTDAPLGSGVAGLRVTTSWSGLVLPEEDMEPTVTLGSAFYQIKSWTLGRHSVNDAGQLVIQHPLDGVTVTSQGVSHRFTGGIYTSALTEAGNSTVHLSKLDLQRDGSEDFRLGAPRLVGMVGYRYNGERLSNPLTAAVDFWAQVDGRHICTPGYEEVAEVGDNTEVTGANAGGTVDTIYPVVALRLPVGELFFVQLDGAGMAGTGTRAPFRPEDRDRFQQDWLVGGAGRLTVGYRDRWQVQASVDGGSGDQDAVTLIEGNTTNLDTTFRPISVISRGEIIQLELPNSVTAGVRAAGPPFSGTRHFPLRYLFVDGEVRSFFRSSTGPVSFGDIAERSLSPYLGTEGRIALQWQNTPDSMVALGGAVFVPGRYASGAVAEDYAEGKNIVFSVNVAISVNL